MRENYHQAYGSRDTSKMNETTIAEHNMVELCIAMWAKRILSVVWLVLAVCLFGVGSHDFFITLAVTASVLSLVSSFKTELLLDELAKSLNNEGRHEA